MSISNSGATNLLIAVPQTRTKAYFQNLSTQPSFNIANIVTTLQDARDLLDDRAVRIDILIMDNRIGDPAVVSILRRSYPRLLIILVDEEADFGLPGQADDLSTHPFEDDDLIKRIGRLMFERTQETLRADSLPAIRQIVKDLRSADGIIAKQKTATAMILDMGFDYVGYYHRSDDELHLRAQAGTKPIQAVAPKNAQANDIMTWTMQNGQSRVASYGEELNHPLVAKGRLGSVASLPVKYEGNVYGVMVACMEKPNAIPQESVLMLELVCTQLALAIAQNLLK